MIVEERFVECITVEFAVAIWKMISTIWVHCLWGYWSQESIELELVAIWNKSQPFELSDGERRGDYLCDWTPVLFRIVQEVFL